MNFVLFCPEQDYQIERSQRLSVSSVENSSTPVDAELETMVTKVLPCLVCANLSMIMTDTGKPSFLENTNKRRYCYSVYNCRRTSKEG